MNVIENEWYKVKNAGDIDSPALLIYPQRVDENIRRLISMAGNTIRLRPHIKTCKSKEAVQMMMQAGISKFKCATIAEAELAGMCEAKDVLLAYQPTGPKLQRFIDLIKKYPETKFSCLTDNSISAEAIATAAEDNKVRIPVYIDINNSMNRTGIVPGDAAIVLYEFCMKKKGIYPAGLHVYDGHIHDASLETRIKQCGDAFAPVESMRKMLKEKGFPEPLIIAGGTPTFPIHSKRNNTECSPGTFIFWDAGYQRFSEQDFLPAALVLTRVVSIPAPDLICLDMGYKSVASENPLEKRFVFLNDKNLIPVSHSEEHLVVQALAGHHYKPGDLLYALPWHICPTVSLYETATTIEDGILTGLWSIIARNRKIEL